MEWRSNVRKLRFHRRRGVYRSSLFPFFIKYLVGSWLERDYGNEVSRTTPAVLTNSITGTVTARRYRFTDELGERRHVLRSPLTVTSTFIRLKAWNQIPNLLPSNSRLTDRDQNRLNRTSIVLPSNKIIPV